MVVLDVPVGVRVDGEEVLGQGRLQGACEREMEALRVAPGRQRQHHGQNLERERDCVIRDSWVVL